MPLWCVILIFELLRFSAMLAVALVVLLIGIWSANHMVTLSAATGALLIPLLLHLLGISFLDKISFFLPLTSAGLLCNQNSFAIATLYYGSTTALGITAIGFITYYAKQGYRIVK